MEAMNNAFAGRKPRWMRTSLACLVSGLLAVTLLCGCSSVDDPMVDVYDTSGGVAATVNGTEIGENAVTAFVEHVRETNDLQDTDAWGEWLIDNGYTMDSLRSEVVDYYVSEELVRQAAQQEGVSVSDSEVEEVIDRQRENAGSDEQWQANLEQRGLSEDALRYYTKQDLLQQALEDVVASGEVSDEDLLESVDSYAQMYDGSKHSAYILFSADDAETAQSVLDQIEAGTLSFEDAAEQYSTDSATASNGGDAGWDKTQTYVDGYQDALDELSAGQVSGLVSTDEGIYIIKCLDVLDAPDEVTSLDQVPESFVELVRTNVSTAQKEQEYADWMTDYKIGSEIETNAMPDDLPYVIDLTPYEES